jgi:hypothetical protein
MFHKKVCRPRNGVALCTVSCIFKPYSALYFIRNVHGVHVNKREAGSRPS